MEILIDSFGKVLPLLSMLPPRVTHSTILTELKGMFILYKINNKKKVEVIFYYLDAYKNIFSVIITFTSLVLK